MKRQIESSKSNTSRATALRKQAEEIARGKADLSPEDSDKMSSAETKQRLHELRVHQIELDIQNEELCQTQAELDASRARYFDLYDLAPVGYVTISEQGLIRETNLTAAKLLGVLKGNLLGQIFSRFIVKEDQDIYYRQRKQLFDVHSSSSLRPGSVQAGESQASELRLLKKGGTLFWAQLESTIATGEGGTTVFRVVISNISERKQLESQREAAIEQLRVSEKKHRDLIENINEIIYEIDARGVILYLSPAVKSISGYDPSELIGKNFVELVHEDDRDLIMKRFADIAHGIEGPFEYRFIIKSGECIWTWTKTMAVMKDGVFAGGRGLLVDISKRKQAEIELAKAEKRFQIIFDIAAEGILIIDKGSRKILYANAAVCSLFGYTESEILQLGIPDLHPMESLPEIISVFDSIKTTPSDHIGELPCLRKNGTTFYGNVNSSEIVIDDKVRSVGFITDITEHKRMENELFNTHLDLEKKVSARTLELGKINEKLTMEIMERIKSEKALHKSEAHFRAVVENSYDGIILMNPERRPFYVSPSYTRFSGYSPEEWMGVYGADLIHPDDREYTAKVFSDVLQSPGNVLKAEYRLRHKRGTWFWVETTVTNLLHDPEIQAVVLNSREITDRKRAESFLKDVIIKNPMSIQVLDKEGFTLEVNSSFELLFGTAPPSGYSIFNDIQLAKQGMGAIFDQLRNGEIVHFPDTFFNVRDSIHEMPDAPVWIKTVGFPVNDSNGKPDKFVLMHENITERKHLEEQEHVRTLELGKLNESLTMEIQERINSEERYRLLANNSTDAIWTMTLDGKVTYVSPSIINLTGYTPEEAREIPFKEQMVESSAEGIITLLAEQLQKPPAERLPTNLIEVQLNCKDGTIKDVEIIAGWLLDDRGEPIGIQGSSRDITSRKRAEGALKESEKKYRLLAENSVAAIWTINLEGNFTYMSLAIKKLLGYTVDEVMEIQMPGIIVQEDYDDLMTILAAEFAKPQEERMPFYKRQIRCKKKDGNLLDAEINVAWLKDDQGNVVGLQGSTSDIAERKKAEQDHVALQVAKKASLAKSTFVSTMSHEIRTPLNAIIGFAQILGRDTDLTPRQAKHVQTITRSSAHLLTLIGDILDMSKIEAGKINLNEAAFCLPDLLDDLETMFRSLAAAKGLNLLVERDESVPRYVTADEGKLRQIFINLLGNAVKFTQAGGVALRVRVETVKGKTEVLRLMAEVEDTGPGIPDEDRGRIFAPFQQAKAGESAGGTGLGLAISSAFVETMGGKLTLKSQVGKGSCFRFAVLLKSGEEVAVREKPAAQRITGPKTAPLLPETMVTLPKEIIQAMQQAVAGGNMARMAVLIAQVEKIDSATGRGLQELANQYDYEKLNQVLGKGVMNNG